MIRDIHILPIVLCDSLRQWFDTVKDDNHYQSDSMQRTIYLYMNLKEISYTAVSVYFT